MPCARSMRRESVMKLALQELSGVSGRKRLLSKNMSSLVEGKSFSINNFSENLSEQIFQNFSDNAASLSEELDFFYISTPLASCSLMLPEKKIYTLASQAELLCSFWAGPPVYCHGGPEGCSR